MPIDGVGLELGSVLVLTGFAGDCSGCWRKATSSARPESAHGAARPSVVSMIASASEGERRVSMSWMHVSLADGDIAQVGEDTIWLEAGSPPSTNGQRFGTLSAGVGA